MTTEFKHWFPGPQHHLAEMMDKLLHFARRAVSPFTHNHHLASTFNSRFCSSMTSSPPPNNKLFVAGLSWSVDEKSLVEAFSSFGEVTEVRIMYDKETGRSRGFGFVHFWKQDEATNAKDAMDGKAFLGRPLRITFALDKVRGSPVVVPRVRNSENAFG